ncbi:PREDICTED: putative disease resistance protein At1g50180 isoform X2 [Prunus mume]|uniref:Disease resistance protein At1g50180 isoform X2 n=1 Tax=Prunus mume TaxID=102107 RepID=A0ABM0NZW5_PRUMU|nr:PREDICTED: putative disease resistance protein At1g50180 isoform X2 [Prunus mume]
MAEAVVTIVAEGIKPLVDYIIQQANFFGGVSDQVEVAQTELQLMLGYLKDADARQGEDEVVRIWVATIRDAAYDLEDVIETFVLKVASRRKGSLKIVLKRFACIFREGYHLYKTGWEIEKITTKLSTLRSSLQSYNIRETRGSGGGGGSFERQQEMRLTYPHVIEREVVGLEDGVNILATHLVEEEKCSRVVSIWGMGGSGKTTIAKQVFHHSKVRRSFDCFAWVCISQQCQGIDVLEEILIKLTSATNEQREEIEKMKKDRVAEKLCIIQRERKCLVVLDDIWTRDAWNTLKPGFPINEETKSRILLTTRNKEVASHVDENGFLYQPHALNDDESWELFEKIALFGRDYTNSESYAKKEELGKKMLQRCAGLPLAISVLAGLLARKDTVEEWNTVLENVDVYIRRGLFPEDYEIPVKRLTKLWVAEGLSSASTEIMEEVSYSCLIELVNRCMVQVGKYGSTKNVKTCRLHDLMRDLCVLKAKEQSFLHTVNVSAVTGTKAAPTSKVRKLAIYLDKEVDKLVPTTDERDGHLRSLLYFVPTQFFWNKRVMRSIFEDFKLLRVLKFEDMLGGVELPSTIGNLVHLRFLSLKNSRIKKLRSSIANLVCLQTLDLRCRILVRRIPNVIRDMEQLKHLYLPASYNRVSGKLGLATHPHLQTLVNVSSKDCDLIDLAELRYLRKLVVEVQRLKNLEEMLKSTSITFNRLRSLSVQSDNEEVLVRMPLSCHHIFKLQLKGPIKELPEELKNYPNLTKISLSETLLKDDQIEILENLPKLRMLFLEGYTSVHIRAFPGTLVCSAGGFPHLEFLSLRQLCKLKEWRMEKGAMPSLSRLHIEHCIDLTSVPDGLQYITTLKELHVKRMPSTFCDKLQEGGQDFYKIQHVPSVMLFQIW